MEEEAGNILVTGDGSVTLRHDLLGELYHSDRGALGESLHVYIGAGFDYLVERGCREVVIFEVGFGTGLNCWQTLLRKRLLSRDGVDVEVVYHAVELYPLGEEAVNALNYSDQELFFELHKSPWGERVEIEKGFTLIKHRCDLQMFDFAQVFDNERIGLVYYDAFAPDVQPDLWSGAIFSRLFEVLDTGGVVVTYTSKGVVKQALRGAGFDVVRLDGALGKRHMLRAVKH